MNNQKYECCFCTKDIDKQVALLTIINNYDKPDDEQITQQFFSHSRYLVKRMDTTIRCSTAEFDTTVDQYECCFCADHINTELASLITINNFEQPKSEQNIQQFYCHTPCFTTQLSYTAMPYNIIDLKNKDNIPKNIIQNSNNEKYARRINMNNQKYECCFCTKRILGTVATLAAISHWEKSEEEQYAQQFFFHMPCFLDTLSAETRSYAILLEPEKIDTTL